VAGLAVSQVRAESQVRLAAGLSGRQPLLYKFAAALFDMEAKLFFEFEVEALSAK
jgi:hypothetical protein